MVRARLQLLAAVVIWGFTFVATKVCLEWVSPIELLGLRLFVALPVLLAVIRFSGVRLDLGGHRRPLALGSLIIGAHFYIQITGLQYTSATNTGWIIAVTPLVMALLAALLLGERLRPRLIAGIAVATSGIAMLVSGGDLAGLGWLRSVGDWLVLASAHTWALYTIAVRDVTRRRPALLVTFAVLLPAGLFTAAWMLLFSDWSAILAMPGEGWVALLYLGVAGTAVAHALWQSGVARLGAAEAGLFLYLEPLATTALAVPYLGERFGAPTLIGGSLVLLGVGLAQRRGRGGGDGTAA